MVLDGTVVSIYYDDTTVSEIACMAIYGIIVVQYPETRDQSLLVTFFYLH